MKNKETKKGKFKWRAFVSIYMGYSFIAMLITGIMLYIAPAGRIAFWTNWKFLGLTKKEWEAVHTLFSFIWIVFAVYHIIFNWKPLINYIRSKLNKTSKVRSEFIYATLFTILVFFGTYFKIPPFSTVVSLGDYITESWESKETEPPVPHAERLTLNEFAKIVKIDEKTIYKTLKQNGLEIPSSQITVQELAEINKTTPDKIYRLLEVNKALSSNKIGNSKYAPGSGLGRKLLSEIFKENKIEWDEGIKILREKGIEVKADEKIKTIAEENGISPIEIIKALNLN